MSQRLAIYGSTHTHTSVPTNKTTDYCCPSTKKSVRKSAKFKNKNYFSFRLLPKTSLVLFTIRSATPPETCSITTPTVPSPKNWAKRNATTSTFYTPATDTDSTTGWAWAAL